MMEESLCASLVVSLECEGSLVAVSASVVVLLSEEYLDGSSLYWLGMSPEWVLKLSKSTNSELGRLQSMKETIGFPVQYLM